ncbi:hypothetical protein RRG12_43405, partial [Nostoc sp. CALU 546]
MNKQEQPTDINEDNESSLEMLIQAIDLEEFSLIFARCNYVSLREKMLKRLKESCSRDIRVIILKDSVQTLYTTIKQEIKDEKPAVLMVFNLELVKNLEQVLISTNQVREEFRNNFPFPVVLWVTDEVLIQLNNSAPDFKTWGIFCEFELATDELVTLLQKNTNIIFEKTLAAGDLFLPNSTLLKSYYRLEINSICKTLK